jgi:thiamine biosynthesis lipoprotein
MAEVWPGISSMPDAGMSSMALGGIEHVMGTAVGIRVRDAGVPVGALRDAFDWLRDVDRRFSTYRAESEISRIGRGDLPEREASLDVRQVLALCDELATESGGVFDARHHRADGSLDPSGVVKGWSVDEAALRLDAAGARNFAINAGGDILARGEPAPGRGWRIGIRHPFLADRVARVLEVRRGAVATSAAYERGEHIRVPGREDAPHELLSVTVVGPSLTYADAYATTAFAMGLAGLDWVARHPGYGVYAITADQRVLWSPVVGPLLADPAPSAA